MLVSEKNMTQNEGVLLSPSTHGLGLQLAGALMRLGMRLTGLNQSPAASHAELGFASLTWSEWDPSKSPFSAAVLMPEPHLARNKALNSEELGLWIGRGQKILDTNPASQLTLVLPQSSAP